MSVDEPLSSQASIRMTETLDLNPYDKLDVIFLAFITLSLIHDTLKARTRPSWPRPAGRIRIRR